MLGGAAEDIGQAVITLDRRIAEWVAVGYLSIRKPSPS
jgi:hypothetical protein